MLARSVVLSSFTSTQYSVTYSPLSVFLGFSSVYGWNLETVNRKVQNYAMKTNLLDISHFNWKQMWNWMNSTRWFGLECLMPLSTILPRGCHGHDCVVVGFTTTFAISAYHHWSCKFESCAGKMYFIQHYVIKFICDLQQVGGFLRVLQFPPPIKLTATI